MTTQATPLTIGLSAKFGNPRSPHLDAFERAIECAEENFPDLHTRYRFVYEDDEASPAGGSRAAKALMNSGAAVVVGHFASGAARAALEQYAGSNTAVILPAATAIDLPDQHYRVFRVCNSDLAMAKAITNYILQQGLIRVAVRNDGSVHGQALADCVETCCKASGIRTSNALETDACLFTGMYADSVQFVNEVRGKAYQGRVFLTDDAQHDGLGKDLHCLQDTFVFGYAPIGGSPDSDRALAGYRAKWQSDPGIYFLETLAAMEMVFECLRQNPDTADLGASLSMNRWHTSIGELDTSRAELGKGRFALWGVDHQALRLICPVDSAVETQSERKSTRKL